MRNIDLSVIIPALNEGEVLETTVNNLGDVLRFSNISFEILIIVGVNEPVPSAAFRKFIVSTFNVFFLPRAPTDSFGDAIRTGIRQADGKYIVFVMADGSENPKDLCKMFNWTRSDYDCFFGERFSRHTVTKNYPFVKRCINRLGNHLISKLFRDNYNDWTNAFKMYRHKVLENLGPFESSGFEISLEIALKAHIAGYDKLVFFTDWYGRKSGKSKFKIIRQIPGYLRVVWKCYWLYREKSK